MRRAEWTKTMNTITDNYWEHSQHTEFDKNCSTCFSVNIPHRDDHFDDKGNYTDRSFGRNKFNPMLNPDDARHYE